MAAGWNLSHGEIRNHFVNEADLWASFRFVFSSACMKRSTYKFGLIKSMLDNILNVTKTSRGMELLYDDLFYRFATNYWNLITKYNLKQMRASTGSTDSAIEQIFQRVVQNNAVYRNLEFEGLSNDDQNKIITEITKSCKKNVIGALYEDFNGQLYGFDLSGTCLWISIEAYDFMLKYRSEIEKLNYYAWAKFLESINTEDVLFGLIGKLEKSTSQRSNLSIYRKILLFESSESTCFYCGCKLTQSVHVDYIIPWSFIKSDHLWNSVLVCPNCNTSMHNHLPSTSEIARVIAQNEQLQTISSPLVEHEFRGYSADLLWKLREYFEHSGLKMVR